MSSGSSYNRPKLTYRPTQFYYSKGFTVSYRYAGEYESYGSGNGDGFSGPQATVFTSEDQEPAPTGFVRSYASVTRRDNPGVPMTTAKSARSKSR
jgi:hypothetical protein